MRRSTVAVIALACLGIGCAGPRTQQEISNDRMIRELPRFAEESVADPERARKVKALSKQAARELRLFYKEMERGQHELWKLRNSKATEAEKEAALARHREQADRRLERIAELREETRRAMTAEEWGAFNEKLMQAQH